MKKLSSAIVALSLCAAVAPAFAEDVGFTNQPPNGFMMGADPEWSSFHLNTVSAMPGSREYHRDAVSALVRWYSDHASQQGTRAYDLANRAMHQLRNMLHRQYHMGLTTDVASPTYSSRSSSSTSSRSSSISSRSSSSVSSSYSSSSSVRRDFIAPLVTTTSPYSNAIHVATNVAITASFSENVDPATLNSSTFTFSDGSVAVQGVMTTNRETVMFRPTSNLKPNTLYTATITTGVMDMEGNRLFRGYTWSFTTEATSVTVGNQASVNLGAASTFAVLAGSTVTNIGQTIVNGDLGVSPGSAVTGFPPGVQSTGSMHVTDTTASAAESALTVAYNDLAGRSTAPVSVSGNLGGFKLSGGLYKSTSGLEVSSGDLTLDAGGDSSAIFIFQIATTLDISSGLQIKLVGGAKASNVYWQVGTSANVGSNAVFKGSILADQSISLQTGATVDGRLLARIGAVTMQGNTITVPSN